MADAPLLELADIETSYGQSRVLFGITLRIAAGEMVSLMGRNGMGKTTTVRSIMGLTPAAAGNIRFNGVQIHGLPAYRIAKLGLGLVPEGRQVFPNLTARENLLATAANRTGMSDPWTLAKVFALFPRLAERAGSIADCSRRATDRQHLLLAAGEQIGHRACTFGELEERARILLRRPWIGHAGAIGRGGEQIFARGQIRKDLAAFRHQSEAKLGDAIGREPVDLHAVETDVAGSRRRKPHDRANGRRFAHAVATHQRHHFARRDAERNTEQHPALAVARFDIGKLQAAGCQPLCPLRSVPAFRPDRLAARPDRSGCLGSPLAMMRP